MFSKINLKDELKKFQSKENSDILDLVNNQLLNDELMENNIKKNLNSCATSIENIDLTEYNKNDVYDLKSIKSIAVKYRLRFLPTKYFKNEIPQEAIFKTKSLEKKNNTSIKNFHILAPATSFDLEDVNKDPLLFAPLKNGKYLLIHQWGTDLAWYKKLSALPLRSLESILISIGFVALLLSIITPTWLILNSAEIDMGYFGYHRIAWFLYAYILISSITTFICFSQNIYPSEYQWNKKTYN
ncbi:MAG: hypothetical protein CL838_07980 [Crocinitomicaceae bacterium]|nr:hypothetical protein [Crocinitomicaceae bacterium]|tara:strand:+ start:2644 stop:3369 length:726 start_codon:yes stop_codon:yes gene_type:complete